MPSNPLFQNTDQGPLKTVLPKGQNAFVGSEKIFFTGTTGQVGTAYGIPGVTVTRSGTGSYDVRYPVAHECDIYPDIQSPTGYSYNINITENFPTSGTAKFNITQQFQFIGSGAVGVSGSVRNYNPTSGSVAKLLMYIAPIAKF
ncbi:MAG: hypothetical protein EPO32_14930 [Anaerolineae bacterium]|nr:MAG: hypothetical protein EPO32_14930 [Anaerolineae bacterium]